jgi:hypothetical protein
MVYADGLKKGEIHREQFAFVKIDTGDIINFSSDLNSLERTLGKAVAGVSSDLLVSWNGLTLTLLPDITHNNGKYTPIPNEYIIRTITVEDSQFATIDGLKIGDDVELVEKTYGEPFIKRSTIYTYFYFNTDDVWNLLFYFNNNKIEKVIILRGD